MLNTASNVQPESPETQRLAQNIIEQVLNTAIRNKASDVHLSPGLPPLVGLRGRPIALDTEPLDAGRIESIFKLMASPSVLANFSTAGEADFAFAHSYDGKVRYFRCNVTKVNAGPGGVSPAGTFRLIPDKILSPEELGLHPTILSCVMRDKGMFLVTGQTGSGKSTTLATLVEYITLQRAVKVITLEQPIEYVFSPKFNVGGKKGATSIIEQQEIPEHIPSFANALRAAMRRAPNIIMVGELRDIDTMVTALQAAETGHLVLGTLHTNTAPDSISRIVNAAPEARSAEIRTLLSTNLIGAMSQVLVPTLDGKGRKMAYEFLLNTSGVAGKIRDPQKIPLILSDIQTGGKYGMQTLEAHLWELVEQGLVSEEEAFNKAARPDVFSGLKKNIARSS